MDVVYRTACFCYFLLPFTVMLSISRSRQPWCDGPVPESASALHRRLCPLRGLTSLRSLHIRPLARLVEEVCMTLARPSVV